MYYFGVYKLYLTQGTLHITCNAGMGKIATERLLGWPGIRLLSINHDITHICIRNIITIFTVLSRSKTHLNSYAFIFAFVYQASASRYAPRKALTLLQVKLCTHFFKMLLAHFDQYYSSINCIRSYLLKMI